MTDLLLTHQPESRMWACAINAFAVASGVLSKQLEVVVGHDGSAVIDDSIQSAERFAGFSNVELIRAMYILGWDVTTITLADIQQSDKRINWRDMLFPERTVIYYHNPNGALHAVAAYKGNCYDTNSPGKIVPITDIPVSSIEDFYVLRKRG